MNNIKKKLIKAIKEWRAYNKKLRDKPPMYSPEVVDKYDKEAGD